MMTGFGKFLKSKADEKKNAKNNKEAAQPSDEDDILAQTFRKFDKDSSGFLDAPEMLKAMQDIMGPRVTNAMVDRVMMEIDKDKSGTIELEEFYDFFEKIDDLVRNGFGQEMETANGSAKAVSSGGGGVSDDAVNQLLAKIAEIQEAQSQGMAKMHAEIQSLKDTQKTQTDALKAEVLELKNELAEVKGIASSLREKDLKKKERRDKKQADGDGVEHGEELS